MPSKKAEQGLVLYGDVGDMWGDGSGFTDRQVLDQLAEFDGGDIEININSGGGLAFMGVAIYNALRAYPGKKTVTIDAVAASAASLIAMAGDEIVVREGASIMIHDPSALTVGNAKAHEDSAARLDKLGNQTAQIYARRSGQSVETVREKMLAETWFDADEAIEFGLATAKVEDDLEAVASFDWGIYQSAPAHLVEGAMRTLPEREPVAAATKSKQENQPMPKKAEDVAAVENRAPDHIVEEVTMQAATPAPVKEEKPAPARKDITLDIIGKCLEVGLDGHAAHDIAKAAKNDMTMALELIVDKMASRDPAPSQSAGPSPVVSMGMDSHEKFLKGAELGLLARAGIEGGERNEFSGLTLRELGRECLMSGGFDRRQIATDPMQQTQQMFNYKPMMAGLHSTSDFTNILSNVANKSVMIGYEEVPETFESWTATGSISDFKPLNRVDLNLFPSLAEVPEGAEYTYASVSDRGTVIQLATFGRMFSVTRQAVVNDDLSLMTRVPRSMGRAARRTIGDLVWAVVTANAVMPDGFALFSTEHANLAASGAAPTIATVEAGRLAMALQRDPDLNATALNLRPSFMLVPMALEQTARVLMASQYDPSNITAQIPNTVSGMMQIVSDARLDADSSTAWYMLAAPSMIDTIEVAYLNGNQSPMLDQRDGWDVDGVEFKVRIDAGVAVHDYRGVYKNAGA